MSPSEKASPRFIAGTIRSAVGAYVRTWGFRTSTGPIAVIPRWIRGSHLRRKVDSGGRWLQAMPGVRFVEGAMSQLALGDHVKLVEHARLVFEGSAGQISVGKGTLINARSEIRCREEIRIGSDCMIAFNVVIMDTDHHVLIGSRAPTLPVTIGDRVWVDARSTIMKGVTIGNGAVIGAGSLVRENVPDFALVAGVPAKVIRTDVTRLP